MDINIELNEENVSKLLDMFGYTSEDVLVWYNKVDENYQFTELGNYWKTIVYPKHHRPEILDNEKVMFDDVKDMDANEVVNTLFNKLLIAKLFS